MRLINLDTLQLEEFVGDDVPPYTILSHTWGPEEVSFTEIRELKASELVNKLGYQKIKDFCQFSLAMISQSNRDNGSPDAPKYGWVDTCCIDKSSSAELSEAINSMFRWYQEAQFCIAHLCDYESEESAHKINQESLKKCRWFGRGWTLQELLAPRDVIFVDKNWQQLGTKIGSARAIASASGIDRQTLITGNWATANVAKRMSWAATRQTTRPEDMAYCLLGLFRVNMPLLYGEGGDRAFLRLQDEIMKEVEDHSIFAWQCFRTSSCEPQPAQLCHELHGTLATHPSQFRGIDHLTSYPAGHYEPCLVTTKGFRLRLPIITRPGDEVIGLLRCHPPDWATGSVGIYLREHPTEPGVFSRSREGIAAVPVTLGQEHKIVMRDIFLLKSNKQLDLSARLITQLLVSQQDSEYRLACGVPADYWDTHQGILKVDSWWVGEAATAVFVGRSGAAFALMIRVDPVNSKGKVGLAKFGTALVNEASVLAFQDKHASLPQSCTTKLRMGHGRMRMIESVFGSRHLKKKYGISGVYVKAKIQTELIRGKWTFVVAMETDVS